MKNLAIITARGGSKRIPRKNIKDFLGKPIIAYSIDAALHSGVFDEVMVSTDDAEIAEVARSFGAKIPFIRSIENSDDFATTADVICEVIESYEKSDIFFDNACCIYPTAPFITAEKLKKSYDLLMSGKFSSVFPVIKFGYPIQRSLKLEDGKITMNWPEHLSSRSQDLTSAYHDSGQFYWFNIHDFFKTKTIFNQNAGAIVITELEGQDIDNEVDWKIAELKYTLLNELP